MTSGAAIDGLARRSLAAGELEAAFVPEAGMIGCSLRHRGEELLGQRRGLRAYVEERSTMGIPLLHPWANRLSEARFMVAGREVALDPTPPMLKLDPGGLPIHGLLGAARGWEVVDHVPAGEPASLSARFDFAAREDLMATFPFAHRLELAAALSPTTLTIATTVVASGDSPVPISFGFHPYLRLPGVARADWEVEIPVRERIVLDDRGLPTGEREPVEVASGRLGGRVFDDAYRAPSDGAPLVLAGGGRRMEVAFDRGYPYAQVYAPAGDDLIALEPMTAPTNALVSGDDLPLLAPGERYDAVFAITVAT